MTDKLKFTTVEASKQLGVTTQWFRLCVKALKLSAEEVVVTGKRGRPADLWTWAQVNQVRSFLQR